MMAAEEKKEAVVYEPVTPATPTGEGELTGTADFFNRNSRGLLIAVGALVLAILAYYGYNQYNKSRDDEAQREMFPAVFAFESDSLDLALKGNGNKRGFLSIIDDYSGTDAGNLAHFYAGVIYMKQGKFAEAAEQLKDYSADDVLVQARAYALIGDAYMEQNNLGEAISYYKKAADYKPNKFFTAGYLMKLALAQELNKDNKGAIESYNTIITKFWDAAESADAKKFKAKLETAGQ